MAAGLLALLDDIALLAKAAAASVDDMATQALKASAKSVGVVVDDAAVTPQYVQGIEPKRELPVIKRIAMGSLRNKFLIILPIALVLSTWAPAVLPWLLLVGGSFLAFEGAEKVLAWFGVHIHPESHHDGHVSGRSAQEVENKLVSGAVRTDLILSTEIMLIALSNIEVDSLWERLGILIIIAFIMTIGVYGVVALLVKMDDLGLRMTGWKGKMLPALGRALVKGMPAVFKVIGVVGTIAMLWVGGHIVMKSVSDIGLVHAIYDFEHTITHAVHSAGGAIEWLSATLYSAVFGLVWGCFIVGVVSIVLRVRSQRQSPNN